MKNSRTLEYFFGTLAFLITVIMVIVALLPETSAFLESLVAQSPELAFVAILFYKAFSIVLAPLSGTVITALAPKFLHWGLVSLATIIGNIIGYSIAFYIAKYIRHLLTKDQESENRLEKWRNQLEEKTGIIGLIALRLISKPIGDYIAYVAGLTKIPFKKFLLVTIIVDIPYETSIALLGHLGFTVNYLYLGVIFVIVGIFSLGFEYWRRKHLS